MNRIAVDWVCQALGLNLSQKGCCQKLIILIHVIYVCGNLKFQFDYHRILYHHPDFVGNTTNLIEMILPILCHLIVVLESFVQSSVEKNLHILTSKARQRLKIHRRFAFKRFCWLFILNSSIFGLVFALLCEVKGKSIGVDIKLLALIVDID